MKLSREELESMYRTCQRYIRCDFCPFDPINGEYGTCPNRDEHLIWAMLQGYRKEDEVIAETVSEIVKLMNDIYCKNPQYSKDEFEFGKEVFEAIDEKYKEVGVANHGV